MTGLFVVFEGGDSAGKTTQSELLCGWLKARGRAFVATRQPGGTEVGSHLRRLVLDPSFGDVSPRAEALMYAADKAQHVHELIGPALARGEVGHRAERHERVGNRLGLSRRAGRRPGQRCRRPGAGR